MWQLSYLSWRQSKRFSPQWSDAPLCAISQFSSLGNSLTCERTVGKILIAKVRKQKIEDSPDLNPDYLKYNLNLSINTVYLQKTQKCSRRSMFHVGGGWLTGSPSPPGSPGVPSWPANRSSPSGSGGRWAAADPAHSECCCRGSWCSADTHTHNSINTYCNCRIL